MKSLLDLHWEVKYYEYDGYSSSWGILCGAFIITTIVCENYRYKYGNEKPHDNSKEAEEIAKHIVELYNVSLAR